MRNGVTGKMGITDDPSVELSFLKYIRKREIGAPHEGRGDEGLESGIDRLSPEQRRETKSSWIF